MGSRHFVCQMLYLTSRYKSATLLPSFTSIRLVSFFGHVPPTRCPPLAFSSPRARGPDRLQDQGLDRRPQDNPVSNPSCPTLALPGRRIKHSLPGDAHWYCQWCTGFRWGHSVLSKVCQCGKMGPFDSCHNLDTPVRTSISWLLDSY